MCSSDLARSGKVTLNIACFMEGEWKDCSKERANDTQQEILNIIGMDSFTFKSCALIMQDQYGLFLQAKPEERVEVLGTLLGLGVYQVMERIAQDMPWPSRCHRIWARRHGHIPPPAGHPLPPPAL